MQQNNPQPKVDANQSKDQKAKKPTSAQNSLIFSEIREDMIIMEDGSFRAVVRCQSINFDLMSTREREGVEYSYQNFLNSLYFPIQILVRSRRIDIGPYIDRLVKIRRSQENMLLNVLMDDYISFIDELSQEANIMDKSFFIIVPFYQDGDISEIKKQAKGLFDSFFSGTKNVGVVKVNEDIYRKAKEEIANRINAVMSGLFQLGVRSKQLNTRQLGELYYESYNPDTSVREPIEKLDFDDVNTTFVRRGSGENPYIEEEEL